MAEWLGTALQKLLQRFESASDLLQNPKLALGVFCFNLHNVLFLKTECPWALADLPVFGFVKSGQNKPVY